jgi:choline dehydrogenase-like flavoprotein
MYGAAGIPMTTLCDEFVRHDGTDYGWWIECPPLHPALASVAVSGFGAEHRASMERFPHIGALICLVRDGADLERSNGSVHVDRRGRTHIAYRLGPTDRRHLVEGVASCARLHLAAGAREVMTLHTRPVRIRSEADIGELRRRSAGPNDVALFSAHVNGTCRMGTNPRTSGTTPDGERHGVPGLFVMDGSLLPTSLGVNPQETIMALASVLSERVARGM